MSDKITADFTTLMGQASDTAHEYFTKAIRTIDGAFGEGHAKKHPELIAAFMRTAGQDFNASVIAKTLQDGMEQVADAIRELKH